MCLKVLVEEKGEVMSLLESRVHVLTRLDIKACPRLQMLSLCRVRPWSLKESLWPCLTFHVGEISGRKVHPHRASEHRDIRHNSASQDVHGAMKDDSGGEMRFASCKGETYRPNWHSIPIIAGSCSLFPPWESAPRKWGLVLSVCLLSHSFIFFACKLSWVFVPSLRSFLLSVALSSFRPSWLLSLLHISTVL